MGLQAMNWARARSRFRGIEEEDEGKTRELDDKKKGVQGMADESTVRSRGDADKIFVARIR